MPANVIVTPLPPLELVAFALLTALATFTVIVLLAVKAVGVLESVTVKLMLRCELTLEWNMM